ncbi:hypothetical protein AB6A40_010053 [Gnathostoma spinigerum]|uniref:Secreted protein n=1 Tax=Gnathostoma spinigerum TaxID=75299 RepID=A0ABD6F0S4_9BILA
MRSLLAVLMSISCMNTVRSVPGDFSEAVESCYSRYLKCQESRVDSKNFWIAKNTIYRDAFGDRSEVINKEEEEIRRAMILSMFCGEMRHGVAPCVASQVICASVDEILNRLASYH